MEFNTLKQLTVEFNPQLYESSVLVLNLIQTFGLLTKLEKCSINLKQYIQKQYVFLQGLI